MEQRSGLGNIVVQQMLTIGRRMTSVKHDISLVAITLSILSIRN